jgi:type VI secretion system protein ImpH
LTLPIDSEISVLKQLFERPYEFQFHQAVRLLARGPLALARQEAAKSNTFLEVARFSTHLSLSFPASEIQSLVGPTSQQSLPKMAVNFMGLYGTYGVLPRYYTHKLMELEVLGRKNPDQEYKALGAWLDLFTHRFIWYFYRAWEKYRFLIHFERGEHRRPSNPDSFTTAMLSLVGAGLPSLQNRILVAVPTNTDPPVEQVVSRLPDIALFRFGGLLAQRHRNAWGLKAFLEGILRIPVHVQQYRGQWMPLEADSQVQVGEYAEDGTCGQLGENIIIGDKVWDIVGKINLRIGPLSYPQFLEFLPDEQSDPTRKSFRYLSQLARLYVGLEFDVSIQLILKAAEVPACRLTDDLSTGPRLGWTCWLHAAPPPKDAEEGVFDNIDDPWLVANSLN